ncbi:hypothetical protein GCM10028798_16300 [Humibacter antri]
MIASALIVGVASALCGCASDKKAVSTGVDYSGRVVVAGQAKLDPSTDSGRLPLDSYALSDSQSRTIDYAIDLSIHSCMTARGQQFSLVDRRQGHDTSGYRLFGVWLSDEAAKYGYALPPQDPVDQAEVKLNAQAQTPATQKAYSACLDEANKKFPRKDPSSSLASQGSAEAYSLTVSHDKTGVSIVHQWRNCMQKNGVVVPSSDVLTVGAASMPKEQQVKVAVQDVECKTQINAVQRLSDIDASYQTVFIAKKQAALNDEKAAIVSVVAKAQAYIDSTH